MTVEINCEGSLYITINSYKDIITICYRNTIVKLYKHEKMRELMFRSYVCYDNEYQEECAIELVVENGGDFVFTFPYQLRYAAMQSYDELFELLKNFN